jgi:hypothetical protein
MITPSHLPGPLWRVEEQGGLAIPAFLMACRRDVVYLAYCGDKRPAARVGELVHMFQGGLQDGGQGRTAYDRIQNPDSGQSLIPVACNQAAKNQKTHTSGQGCLHHAWNGRPAALGT